MFKSILPSKRIVSSDFTMVTNLGDPAPNGKENQPSVGAIPPSGPSKSTRAGHSATKGSSQSHEKKKRDKKEKEQQQPAEAVGMNQAFDQLLVCL